MYERFTDRAKRTLVLAQEEARLMNHAAIGTEHLLLGLIHEGEGVAGRVLADAGIELEKVRDRVWERCPVGSAPSPSLIPFTPRAKKVLELSLREALQLGHNYIGTEHMLLGIIREGEGTAAIVLEQLGVSLSDARRAVIAKLSGGVTTPPREVAGRDHVSGYITELLRRAAEFGAMRENKRRELVSLLKDALALLDEERRARPGRARIQFERERQVAEEGWSAEHDHAHMNGELYRAAVCYLNAGDADFPRPASWPWSPEAWKPKDRVSNLIRAGALLLAHSESHPDDPPSAAVPYLVNGIGVEIDRIEGEGR